MLFIILGAVVVISVILIRLSGTWREFSKPVCGGRCGEKAYEDLTEEEQAREADLRRRVEAEIRKQQP